MNDIVTEADNNPNNFVWEDGNESSYRQFATNPSSYPSGVTAGSDCVSFRYKNLNVVSDGWYDRECNGAVFSYYCNRQGELLILTEYVPIYVLFNFTLRASPASSTC